MEEALRGTMLHGTSNLCSRGMFSQIQRALIMRQSPNRIAITKDMHAVLDHFRTLAASVVEHSTKTDQKITLDPSAIGAHNASGKGAEGVFFVEHHIVPRFATCQKTPTYLSHTIPTITEVPVPTMHTIWSALSI